MRTLGTLLFITVVIAATLLALPPDEVASKPGGKGPVCKSVAKALWHTSRIEADADYWLSVANCLNKPGQNLPRCLWEAWKERREARDLADDQLSARMELCQILGHGPYAPKINPKDFSPHITNSYLPFKVGRILIYEKKTEEDEIERVTITVLKETVEINGIECRAVRDLAEIDGEVEEDTVDWFAQHKNGDVWYIGEIAKNYEDGMLDNLDGSWRYGKDDALPGILIPATFKVGRAYRQEYQANEAEDVARIIGLNKTVKVKAGTFTKCVQTEDWSPLEPDAREHKYYAPGIGVVLEVDLDSGERLELVKIIDP